MTNEIIIKLTIIIVALIIIYKKRTSGKKSYQKTVASPSKSDEGNQEVITASSQSAWNPYLVSGFGYKCVWFAVKTSNKIRVAEILGLKNIIESNWGNGIDQAYKYNDYFVFITPAIDGWTLATGQGISAGDSEESVNEIKELLNIFSKEFGEAQFFANHRVVDFYSWMKSRNGQFERRYWYIGGYDTIEEGVPTDFEKALHLATDFNTTEEQDIVLPRESTVMKVAENWSVDPTKLEERKDLAGSFGLLGVR